MGMGAGSPSRDAANWRFSRFSRSVETRRRYGWLRIALSGARLFELQFGAFREMAACERQGELSRKALVALYRIGTKMYHSSPITIS